MALKRIKTKIILDTNIWLSILIKKKTDLLDKIFSHPYLQLIYCEQLLTELEQVAKRPKFERYFSSVDISELIELIKLSGIKVELTSAFQVCRDEKDNFILSLINDSISTYLVTGDHDLIALHPFRSADIINLNEFEQQLATDSLTRVFE